MLVAVLVASVLIEWVLYVWPWLWQQRRYAVVLPVILSGFGAAALVFSSSMVGGIALLLVAAFRVFNLVRIAEGRMHERYLLRATRRTGLILGVLQLGVLAARDVRADGSMVLGVLVVGQVIVSLGVIFSVVRSLIKTKRRSEAGHFADRDLPTLTVAIPARNETADLEACVRSVLASTYPKLEVLVLDDCSQDKTAEVIKSFAHDGVRFVKGYEPGDRWLAKNQAYDKLADEASGEFILFAGVDVRFGPDAFHALVATLLTRKKDMVSVMPRRLHSDVLAAFIQPMRYWWEMALPRRYFNRPPVLSTCWLIRRKTLKKLGGLEAVQHAILPEGYFARELVKTDGYSFIRADDQLDVRTEKNLAAQRETAIRMRYPEIRRRPEWVLLLSLAEVLFLLGPFVIAASALWLGVGYEQLAAALAGSLLIASHALIVRVTNPSNFWIALVNFPIVVLTELYLGYTSMLKYEFSEVIWKGRNVCVPVMHVYPKLPSVGDPS